MGEFSTRIYDLVTPNGNSVDYAGRYLMPDLADRLTTEFYEIKSIYSLGAAYAQVENYQYYLNQANPARHPGEGFTPSLFTPINESTFAIVFNAGPGVISYCVVSSNELLGIAGVLLMIAGIAGVAGGEDPELEQELENPQLYPTPVPVRPFTLPAVDLAAEELDIGTAALLD